MRIRNVPNHVSTEPWFPNTSKKENQIFSARTNVELSAEVLEATRKANENPADPELWVCLGRTYRRQNMFREAAEAYSIGMTYHPFFAPLYRHRGHAYLNTGRFEESVGDFETAILLDPSDIDMWYHQGVSFFMLGNYERAVRDFRRVLTMTDENGSVTCTSDWLWRSLMRLGERKAAEELEKKFDLEKRSGSIAKDYYQVHRMYQGQITPEELLAQNVVTSGFGVANYYLVQGEEEKGIAACKKIVEYAAEKEWGAFGYRASIVELEKRGLI